MVYVFDPMKCEEPHLPDYEYSPIPKAVACCDCDCGCDSGLTVEREEDKGGSELTPIIPSESTATSESESVSESVTNSQSTSEELTPPVASLDVGLPE